MHALPTTFLAIVGQPLFGSLWLALAVVLAGIALFTFAVAGLGRWLAATHPDPVVAIAPLPSASALDSTYSSDDTPLEVVVAIAAAVYSTQGAQAQIVSVKPVPVSVEALMQQWSLEGRRQIYSSHKVR